MSMCQSCLNTVLAQWHWLSQCTLAPAVTYSYTVSPSYACAVTQEKCKLRAAPGVQVVYLVAYLSWVRHNGKAGFDRGL